MNTNPNLPAPDGEPLPDAAIAASGTGAGQVDANSNSALAFEPPNGELAGFWTRFGAYLLDQVLYGLLLVPFAIAGGTMIFTQFDCIDGTDDVELVGSVGLVVTGAMVIAAGVLLSAGLYLRALALTGRTWGNRIVGIEVVNSSGTPVGWGSALLRTVVSCLGSSSLYSVGFLWMLGNPERQTWHDKIARTFVRRS